MWPAPSVFHRSCQIIWIRHDLKGKNLVRILLKTESRISNDTWEAKKRFFISVKGSLRCSRPGGGEGGTPLYKLYRYVPTHRAGFLPRFGLKTGIQFAHFGLESVWFSRKLRKCMNVFIVSIPMSKKERKRNMRIRNGVEEFFVCALI